MKTNNRPLARISLAVCSAVALAATGCTTSHVHTRTVYVPAPPPVILTHPTPPAPQPPVVVTVRASTGPETVIRSEADFYGPLEPHGRWVIVAGQGRCWIPARVESGWRPYCNGYWQRTDAGWYWMSDEPWGWATYHYGRWDWQAEFGWFWIPQTEWAPAWVCWREGGGYVGWAPLRPSFSVGISFGRTDCEPVHASRAFVFVEHRRMLEPVRPRTMIVNNTTIINQTVNITNIKVVNKTIINEGPRLETVERASGRKVHSVAAREIRDREETSVVARERNRPMNHNPKPVQTARETSQSQVTTPLAPRNPIAERPATAQPNPAPAPLARTEVVTTPSPLQQSPIARPESPRERSETVQARLPVSTKQAVEAPRKIARPVTQPAVNVPARQSGIGSNGRQDEPLQSHAKGKIASPTQRVESPAPPATVARPQRKDTAQTPSSAVRQVEKSKNDVPARSHKPGKSERRRDDNEGDGTNNTSRLPRQQ